MQSRGPVAGMTALLVLCGGAAGAQETSAPKSSQSAAQEASKDGAPVALTLKRAIELALENSKEIQVAKIQASVADRTAQITKSQFMPSLYAGSGAGYTYGIPETPGGRAPSIFNVSYTEQIFNEPLRGQAKETEEQSKAQKIALEETKNSVITRTAMAYLELGKVRHSLELLRKEQESAEKILQVTQDRQGEGYELPVEVTKDQLRKAQVIQRILQLEGREDELEVFLRYQFGFSEAQPIEVMPEELPGEAEQAGDNLVAMAMTHNAGLQLAASDVRVPIFSAPTKAAIGMARINLEAAQVNLLNKKTELTADVRQKTRRVRERDAAKEVARLELQLAQQSVAVFQSQFAEGKLNLREVEKARLEENEKWMAYLDANFQKQQAQLELLKTAGQLDKVWQ